VKSEFHGIDFQSRSTETAGGNLFHPLGKVRRLLARFSRNYSYVPKLQCRIFFLISTDNLVTDNRSQADGSGLQVNRRLCTCKERLTMSNGKRRLSHSGVSLVTHSRSSSAEGQVTKLLPIHFQSTSFGMGSVLAFIARSWAL
jgi:hypothetical protein